MAANFPSSLPSIARVLPTDYMNDPGKEADLLHNEIADEIEALAAAVGVTGSAVAGTVEARLGAITGATDRLLGATGSHPRILIVGDSTVIYACSLTVSPTAAVGNADGTVTVQFASSQSVHLGDRVGFSESGNTRKFCATESVITAVSESGPYFYTFAPDETPTVGTHPTPSNLALAYLDRGSSGGFATEFKALLGAGFDIVIAGNAGDTIGVIKARLPALLDRFAPTNVMLAHGINDCFLTTDTPAQVVAEYASVNEIVSNAGAVLAIVGPPPQPSTRGGWTTAKRDWLRDFRRAQAAWCKDASIDYTDWWGCAAGSIQAVNPTDSNGNPNTSVIGTDLIHPALAGNYLVGKALAAKYRAKYPLASAPLAQSVLDGGIIVNPLMTGTGGTRTNGTGTVAAGNVADGMEVTVTAGTATVTPYQTARTVADDGDTCGNWQGASMVAVAAGDKAEIRTPALHTLVTNGSRYRLLCEVKLKTGSAICKQLGINFISQTSITGNKLHTWRSTIAWCETPHPENAVFVADMLISVRGPQAVHGAPTALKPALVAVASAAGTIEFEIARLSIVPVAT